MKKTIYILSVVACAMLAADLDKELLASLEEVSEIATKTLLNIDEQPSVVSVMRADELKKLGVKNIAEALQTLPGIQLDVSSLGYTVVTVRGLKNPNEYLSDKIKLLIDGVAVNSVAFGTNYFYLDFPLELVERIEVLRGPGSTVYGEGAFYGTVNVITKSSQAAKQNEVFGSFGSYGFGMGGASYSHKKDGWRISVDTYYQENTKAIDLSSEKAKGSPVVDWIKTFYRPLETNEAFRDYSFGVFATNDDLTIKARYKKSRYGNFYGMEGRLESQNDTGHESESATAEVDYSKTISGVKLEAKGGFMQYSNTVDERIRQQAWINNALTNNLNRIMSAFGVNASAMTSQQILSFLGLSAYPQISEDEIAHAKIKEQTIYTELTAKLPVFKGHSVMLGAAAGKSTLIENSFSNNVETMLRNTKVAAPYYDICTLTQGREPGLCGAATTLLLQDNLSRQILSLYAQDEFAALQNVDMTLGWRYDDYTDGSTQLSYRLASVYRHSANAVFKAMYGSSYRAPSWFESHALTHYGARAGKTDIKPEETGTYELSAIFKDGTKSLKINGYFSHLKNVIDIENIDTTYYGYTNYDSRISKGLEAEYAQRIGLEHIIKANATANHTSYRTTDNPSDPKYQTMPDVAQKMIKLSWLYEPINGWTLGTLARAVSSTVQNQAFSKDTTVAGYCVWDETVTYDYDKDTAVRVGIKNLFDRDIRMPSYYYRDGGGVLREGRNYSVSFSKKF